MFNPATPSWKFRAHYAFIYHFASAANLKENSYIICGNTSPIDIMKKAGSIGIDLKKENVRFIDCLQPDAGEIGYPEH